MPCKTASCQPATLRLLSANIYNRPWRYGFEGMLKVPYTPFILGISVNIAAQHPEEPGFLVPPDDLRFLFGARFDAKTLIAPLTKLGK